MNKAETILQKAVQAMGGERYGTVKTISGRGYFTDFKELDVGHSASLRRLHCLSGQRAHRIQRRRSTTDSDKTIEIAVGFTTALR